MTNRFSANRRKRKKSCCSLDVICIFLILTYVGVTLTNKLSETPNKDWKNFTNTIGLKVDTPQWQKDYHRWNKVIQQKHATEPFHARHIKIKGSNWHLRRVKLPEDIEKIEQRFTRPTVVKVDPLSKWQVHITKRGSIRASSYGAYFDDRTKNETLSGFAQPRPSIGEFPKVRASVFLTNWTVFCQLWYDDLHYPHIVEGVVFTSESKLKFEKVTHVRVLLSCPTRREDMPTYVSFTHHWRENSTIFLPVNFPKRSNRITFGHHVHPSWGYIYPPHLVEWFELYRLFGIEEFNFYNRSLSKDLDPVFKYYKKLGLLNFYDSPLPFQEKYNTNFDAAVVHTQYMNMYRYKYLLASDLDEIIVPFKHKTYFTMMQHVDSTINNHSQPHYCVTLKQFLKTFPKDESNSSLLQTLQYRISSAPEPIIVLPKSFSSLEHCLYSGNHGCWGYLHDDKPVNNIVKHTPGDTRWLQQTHIIDTKVALNFHYRDQCKHTRGFSCEQTEQDNTMLQYEKELLERVSKILHEIGFTDYRPKSVYT